MGKQGFNVLEDNTFFEARYSNPTIVRYVCHEMDVLSNSIQSMTIRDAKEMKSALGFDMDMLTEIEDLLATLKGQMRSFYDKKSERQGIQETRAKPDQELGE